MAQADVAASPVAPSGIPLPSTSAVRPPVRRGWDGVIELTDIPGAARLAAVSRRTIYNWIAKDLIETRKTPSGKLRVVVATLWQRDGAAIVGVVPHEDED